MKGVAAARMGDGADDSAARLLVGRIVAQLGAAESVAATVIIAVRGLRGAHGLKGAEHVFGCARCCAAGDRGQSAGAAPDEGEALATVAFAVCSVATTICFVPLLLPLSVAMGVFALRNNFMGLEISQAYVRFESRG